MDMASSKKVVKGAFPQVPDISPPQGQILSREVLSASDKARRIIGEAYAKAEEVKLEAEEILKEVNEEMEKARKKGYEEGRQEGLAQYTEEILKLRGEKETFFGKIEPEIIKLTMAAAEKVIGKIVESQKEVVKAVVAQAIEHSLGDRIVVRVHPEDLKRIKAEEFEFQDKTWQTKQLHFKEDASIRKGGCVVETEVGTIDAQLETQFKAIRKALGI